MRATILFGALTAAVLAVAALADGLSDANAGMDALNRGDYDNAVQLFTKAIASGELSPADKELAYVKRAQAYIGENHNDLALADLDSAQKLDPHDSDIAALRAQAQGAPAAAPSNGPTLEETLDFIRNKIVEQGEVKYTVVLASQSTGETGSALFDTYYTNVTTDPAACQIRYHVKLLRNNKLISDMDIFYPYTAIESIQVVPLGQYAASTMTNPDVFVQAVTPPAWNVMYRFAGNPQSGMLIFSDEDIANRVAKAMLHAAELCGAKGEPF
jgi:tetratricopeptide (TPR) repeat protein